MSFVIDRKKLSQSGNDFINEDHLHVLLNKRADAVRVRDVIAKSMAKQPLAVEETAVLLAADQPELVDEILNAARQLKRDVYGSRIVIFAPLYVDNERLNDCHYCSFRRSNRQAVRRTLDEDDIRAQVLALENQGHKRLILMFGDHPDCDAEFIAECVHHVYSTTSSRGEIRQVSINAAPMDHRGCEIIKEARIATYQIFQETYHHKTYKQVHPPHTRKGDYLWRLDGVARAIEAECDVGIGALFGLYDWRFEVLALVEHALHLHKHYNIGPHTISFPRLRPAKGVKLDETHLVSDEEFKRLVAILRLSVPYSSMILSAREPPELRREVMEFGISQIDAGSRIKIGGYTEADDTQVMEGEQPRLGDIRSLEEVLRELLVDDYIPSFCTACYRLGRTGEQFREFAIPGFIQNQCTPNALTTLLEYLLDYASPDTFAIGEGVIRREVDKMPDGEHKRQLLDRLERIRYGGERDLPF
ncbi:MAG TPA: [FeFe] hydrogenase H-cluster radical SAM maturase HydG [Thermoguttaceae bacterium]